jgi:DNA mismatch endonuclease (patch repair protein)
MAQVRNRDTHSEMALRRQLHGRGLRYRVNRRMPELGRTRPDIVFPRERVAVFVDGCFWHKCPEHASFPQTNAEWWAEKLDRNEQRDRETDRKLKEFGWHVIRIWEHVSAEDAADIVERVVLKHRTH